MFKKCAALALLCLGTAAPGSAQIYSWIDANGHLVLSDRPQPGHAPVPASSEVRAKNMRTARDVTSWRINAYDDVIAEHARLNGVRPELVRAVVLVESAFNPYARSRKGALGLMQLMPATAREFGVADPFIAVENVRGGSAFLRRLLDRYGNDEQLALAAYNAGLGAVDRYGKGVPPYRETRDYVSRIEQIAGPPAEIASSPALVLPVLSTKIYRIVEPRDGHEFVTYTNKAPSR